MTLVSDEIIVGLDIGTVKITAVIGEYEFDKNGIPKLNIIGLGTAVSDGIRNGVVVNIESTVKRIIEAVESAEHMSGRSAREIVCGIGGAHVDGCNSKGVAAVAGKRRGENREITDEDINKALVSASAFPRPLDREVLHIIPMEFIVDGQGGIKDPKNMIGTRLEAEVHVITGTITATQNLRNCIERAGYEVSKTVPLSLATCKAVFTPEEEKSGVMLIDLGGGTTDVVVSVESSPYYTGVIPIGGNNITSDLAIVLKLPVDIAEKIKINQGVCHESLVGEDEEIILPISGSGWADKVISRMEVCEIIKARVWEIFSEVKKRIVASGCIKSLNGGIILTGGTALLPGICEFASEFFQMPVRVGRPSGLVGPAQEYTDPRYAGAVGLAKFVFAEKNKDGIEEPRKIMKRTGGNDNSEKMKKVADWFKEFF